MSKQSDAVKKWRKNTKQRIIDSMGGKCQCCGYDKCNEALDIHHIDPAQKEISFGAIRANPTAWPNIVRELKKCILVCRNCHAEIHHAGLIIPNTYSTFDESYTTYKIIDTLSDPCPVCQTLKPKYNKFCSLSCSGQYSHSVNGIDWDRVDLRGLLLNKSVSQIAAEFNVSIASVTKQLNKRKIPYQSQDGHKRPPLEELLPLVSSLSMQKIAQRYKTTKLTIQKWFKHYNITERPFAN